MNNFFKSLFTKKSKSPYVEVPYNGRTLLVSPDYYKVNGVRKPMGMNEVKSVLKLHNSFLPTPEMVDAIWNHADLKLSPHPMPPGPQMTSVDYYVRHSNHIDEEIGDTKFTLAAGHKKDIVHPKRKGRVTIYGWHYPNGKPIQPESSVHGSEYYDYSHGLRIVKYKD